MKTVDGERTSADQHKHAESDDSRPHPPLVLGNDSIASSCTKNQISTLRVEHAIAPRVNLSTSSFTTKVALLNMIRADVGNSYFLVLLCIE